MSLVAPLPIQPHEPSSMHPFPWHVHVVPDSIAMIAPDFFWRDPWPLHCPHYYGYVPSSPTQIEATVMLR